VLRLHLLKMCVILIEDFELLVVIVVNLFEAVL